MNTWIVTALAAIARIITTASARHLGIAIGGVLILLGIPCNSLATVILGGAVVVFCLTKQDTPPNAVT